jgi:hypothetical protein
MADSVVVQAELRDELRREYRGYRVRVVASRSPTSSGYQTRIYIRKGGEPGEVDILRGCSVVASTQGSALCGGLEVAKTRIDGYAICID